MTETPRNAVWAEWTVAEMRRQGRLALYCSTLLAGKLEIKTICLKSSISQTPASHRLDAGGSAVELEVRTNRQERTGGLTSRRSP